MARVIAFHHADAKAAGDLFQMLRLNRGAVKGAASHLPARRIRNKVLPGNPELQPVVPGRTGDAGDQGLFQDVALNLHLSLIRLPGVQEKADPESLLRADDPRVREKGLFRKAEDGDLLLLFLHERQDRAASAGGEALCQFKGPRREGRPLEDNRQDAVSEKGLPCPLSGDLEKHPSRPPVLRKVLCLQDPAAAARLSFLPDPAILQRNLLHAAILLAIP